MQGGRPARRHDVDVLRDAQLHRAGDPARRGVRLQRGLVGARRAHLRDAGRPEPLRHRAGRRQPRPEHRGLPLPGDPREDDPYPPLAVSKGRVRPEGLPQQEPLGAARLRRERLHGHRAASLLQEHRVGNAGAEAGGAALQAAAGGRARPGQLPARVHRRARAPHARQRQRDRGHRPVGVRRLRVREPAPHVAGGLRVTPRLPAAPLPRPRHGVRLRRVVVVGLRLGVLVAAAAQAHAAAAHVLSAAQLTPPRLTGHNSNRLHIPINRFRVSVVVFNAAAHVMSAAQLTTRRLMLTGYLIGYTYQLTGLEFSL